MKKLLVYAILTTLFIAAPVMAAIRVVASTSDLAYFAKEVGGDLVEVSHIAPPNADIHFIEVRPSYMIKVARADVALKIGLELDMWMDRIIDGSRNSQLIIVDCSGHIEPLEVPSFKADARYGDLHRFGNPHYWLSPTNVRSITDAIIEGLAAADPEHADQFYQNQATFLSSLEKDLDRLRDKLKMLQGIEVVYYHNSWPYFNQLTGITSVGFVEPYPGVPPSPHHIRELTELVRGRGIKLIAVEPYFDKRVPNRIASESGARVVTLYPSIGGRDKNETYIQWLEGNINTLIEALK
jgi:zinc/manganese transport system substrate-binding protein